MSKNSNSQTDPIPQINPTNLNPLITFEQEDKGKKIKVLKRKEPKIIFFGNTKYSVIGAQILDQSYPLTLVVTIPDRIVGREKILTPSPVKLMAQKLNIPVIEAEKLTSEIISQIALFQPDFLVV